MRKICIVTGTRAEYGLLSRLMRMIQDSKETRLQVIATNMHLSPVFGNTYQEIEKDGFPIDYKISILGKNDKDNAVSIVKSMAKALAGFADAFQALKPDLIVVLGDRFEILAAAEAALIQRIPIAHIHGGEITEGAMDDAIRHSITKMSHLHFTATEEYRKRVIQLGEQPKNVFYVGALGVENIKKTGMVEKKVIEKEIEFPIDDNTILVTYHPTTLGKHAAEQDIHALLEAFEERKGLRIIFTMPNSDPGNKSISDAITSFVKSNENRARAFKSLGVKRYLSVMHYVAAVVGNSSSGILETPSFGIPTLDIGERQKGRIAAKSVLHCDSDKASIQNGLDIILSPSFREKARSVLNPYEKKDTSKTIFDIISTFPLGELTQKHFYDIR